MNNMSKKQEIIGLIDADLLDNGTRHPNLVLLKLAGFFQDNGIPFELILDPQANTLHYTRIYLSLRLPNYQNYIYDQKEHRKKRSLNVEELDFMPMK